MAIEKEIKKRITEEWLSSVPQLSAFAQNKLYRVVGCSIIGVELIKLPHSEEYRPLFVCYPLWKDDVKKCLDAPFIYFAPKNNKGLQFDIPYLKHSTYFNEAIECLKKQVSILFAENVSLETLFSLIDNVLENDITCKFNSGKVASLFEFKFYACLYTGDQIQVQYVFNQIEQVSKNWNMKMFEIWYGKFDTWLEELKKKQDNRDEFLKQIEANKQDMKIAKLQYSELIA